MSKSQIKIVQMNNLSKMKLSGVLPENSQKVNNMEIQNIHGELIRHIVKMSHSEDYSHVFRALTLVLARSDKS